MSTKPTRTPAQIQLAKAKAKADREKWISLFRVQAKQAGLPPWVEEYRFGAALVGWDIAREPGEINRKQAGLGLALRRAGLRDWRFDVAWPELKVAVELDGAVGHGRHTRREGFIADTVKINAATAHGWRVFRFPGPAIKDGSGVGLLRQVLHPSGEFVPLAGYRSPGEAMTLRRARERTC